MFSPFSDQAKAWEPHGQRLRALGGCGQSEILDPYKLAPKLKLTVMAGEIALALLSSEIQQYLSNEASNEWSGGVFPNPLPDGTFLCILNPAHAPRRNRITLMEEIAHRYMNHQPTKVLLSCSDLKARDFDKACETEAYGIGAAALLPWCQFFELVNNGQLISTIADRFEVSQQLVEYRIKITGASRLYAARQRARVTPRHRSRSAVPRRDLKSA